MRAAPSLWLIAAALAAPAARPAETPARAPLPPVEESLVARPPGVSGTWHFSPDNRRIAIVTGPYENRRIIVDGVASPVYADVTLVRFTPEGRLLYAARAGGKAFVVVDGKEETRYDYLLSRNTDGPTFSPYLALSADGKHYAYVGVNSHSNGGGSFLILDGKVVANGVLPDSLVFSPDGKHFAYTANHPAATGEEAARAVFHDGRPGPAYREVTDPLFTADGQHLAYMARRDGQWRLVLDGVEGPPYHGFWSMPDDPPMLTAPQGLHLSPAGARIAFAVRDPYQWRVVCDGVAGPFFDVIYTMQFSLDGRHFAYGGRRDGRLVLMLNGREAAVFDDDERLDYSEEAFRSGPVFSPDSNRLAWIERRNGKMHVVLDGVRGPPLEAVSFLKFSPDSKHLSYDARQWGQDSLFEDNRRILTKEFRSTYLRSPDWSQFAYTHPLPKPGSEYGETDTVIYSSLFGYSPVLPGEAGGLTFSPDSRHLAYIARDGKGLYIQHDRDRDDSYHRVGMPVFSPDSRHLAYTAFHENFTDGRLRRKQVVVLDGRAGPEYDNILPAPSSTDFGADQFVAPGLPQQGLRFTPEGALEYYAFRDGALYRVRQPLPALPPTSADE